MGFAPGTAPYGSDQERRFRHQAQRNYNIADLMLGLGAMAQALGQRRRAAEEQANSAYLAQQVMQPSGEGGGQAPSPWETPPETLPGAKYGGMQQRSPEQIETAGQSYRQPEMRAAPPSMPGQMGMSPGRGEPLRYARPASAFTNLVNTFNPLYRPQGALTGEGAVQIAKLKESREKTVADERYRRDVLKEREQYHEGMANKPRSNAGARTGYFEAQRKVDSLNTIISTLQAAGGGSDKAMNELAGMNKWPTIQEATKQLDYWTRLRDQQRDLYEGAGSVGQAPQAAAPADQGPTDDTIAAVREQYMQQHGIADANALTNEQLAEIWRLAGGQ